MLTGGAGADEDKGYRISDWHVDGSPEERVVATAVCYLEVAAGLNGGHLVLAQDKSDGECSLSGGGGDGSGRGSNTLKAALAGLRAATEDRYVRGLRTMGTFSQGTGTSTGMSTGMSTGSSYLTDDDDDSGPFVGARRRPDTDEETEAAEESAGRRCRVAPASGTVAAFANGILQHKVGRLSGAGRRRIVAFNVVHPDSYAQPAHAPAAPSPAAPSPAGTTPAPLALPPPSPAPWPPPNGLLPRQLRSACLADAAACLCRLGLGARPMRLLCEFAVDAPGAACLLARRDKERGRRLRGGGPPPPPGLVRATTGFFHPSRFRRMATGVFPRPGT